MGDGSKPFVRNPVYLADEVGLGKTLEVISVITFLSGMMQLQDRGGTLPPIISMRIPPILTYMPS